MSITNRYNAFCNRIAELSQQIATLSPNADDLEKTSSDLLRESAEIREIITKYVEKTESDSFPSTVSEITATLESIEREAIVKQAETARRASVLQMTRRLKSAVYEDRKRSFAKAGEKARLHAMELGLKIADRPDLCRVICGDTENPGDLLEIWIELDEDQRECLVKHWPPELDPIAELVELVGGLRFAVSDVGASDPTIESPTQQTRLAVDDISANPTSPASTSSESGEKPKKSTERRRNELRRNLGTLLDTQDIINELDRFAAESTGSCAELLDADSSGGGTEVPTYPASESDVTVETQTTDSAEQVQSNGDIENQGVDPVSETSVASTDAECVSEIEISQEEGAEASAASADAHPIVEEADDTDDVTNEGASEELDELDSEEVCSLAWHAIAYERLSLAYCVLRAATQSGSGVECLPPELASTVLLSQLVETNSTEIAERLKTDFGLLQEYLQNSDHESIWSQRLLISSAAMRPSLIAPMTDAVSLLTDEFLPSDQLKSYTTLCRAIAKYGEFRLEVDPAMLTGARELAEWQEQFDSQLAALDTWWQSEKCAKVIYAHTTNVWHHWLREDEVIGKEIQTIQSVGVDAIPLINQFVSNWTDERVIDRRCKLTDDEKRGKGAKRRPIDGRALQAIRQKVHYLCDLLNAIQKKIEAMPDKVDDFIQTKVMDCRTSVLGCIDQTLVELNEYRTGGSHAIDVHAALKVTIENVNDVKRMFTDTRLSSPPPERVPQLLTSELALVPGISATLHTSNEGLQFDSDDLRRILKAIEEPLTVEDAFSIQTEESNHAAAQRLLLKIESRSDQQETSERFRRLHEESLEADRIRLKAEASKTEQRIDEAVCYDLVNENVRQHLAAEVSELTSVVDLEMNLSPAFAAINSVNEKLDRLLEARLSEVRARFDELKRKSNDLDEEDLKRIEETLGARDFATADEYINLVRKGEHLNGPESEESSAFHDFFNDFLPAIEDYLRTHATEQLPNWKKQLEEGGEEVYGRKFNSEEHRATAAKILETWRLAIRLGRNDEKRAIHVASLFKNLGFDDAHVEHLSHGNGWSLDSLTAQPIANRNICTVPQFGSTANGRYQVLSMSGKTKDPDIDKILSDTSLDRLGTDVPLVVLFLGRLSKARRRAITKQCWGVHQLLLLDEHLVMFLATLEQGVQNALFQCTLPFTASQPYSITASFVPIEMFFGRNAEYKAIVSREPTHLVFGGRQLGKSVLLREAERRLHKPANGSIVRWIDLKNRGIGTQRPAVELWDEIGHCLHNDGVLKHLASQEGTIRARVKEWLDEDSQRRILLLLDEADEFLNQDSQQIDDSSGNAFPVISQIKGLMDDTERRFKVVFAGLHNVQRAAKDKNTPMGHLGTSINIGPLIDNGEWEEAVALIQTPMRQMGFAFESANLVTRILSHTNFYPSLIQIFCRHLLRSMHKRNQSVIDFRTSPPYPITMKDIERVYQSEELQAEIRDRFELTLNLDERYRLIAFLIAWETIEMREDGEPLRGLTLREIHQRAHGFWSEGFAQDSSFDGFGILLDEMVGLGVLRRDPDGKYALRSANVLNLMGSRQRIEESLMDVASSPPPSEYKASTFRRVLADDAIHRSPLTSQQEGRVLARSNGVTLLTGCPLANLGDVTKAFASLNKTDVHFETYDGAGKVKEFLIWVENARQGREGLSIVLVPATVHWDQVWIQSTYNFLAKKKSATKNFIRVVFIADPPKLWNVDIDDTLLSKIDPIQLHPWSESILDRWLDDNSFNREANGVNKLHETSGGWGLLIQQLAIECGDEKHLWMDRLSALAESWPTDAMQNDWLQLPLEPKEFLSNWVSLDAHAELELPDLEDLAGGVSVQRLIDWAARLCYIRPGKDGAWRLNSLIGRGLQADLTL